MRGEYSCPCCGAKEARGGCVMGLRCGCSGFAECPLCLHCTQHHHRRCTDELRDKLSEKLSEIRLQTMLMTADMQKANGINIFERGEKL